MTPPADASAAIPEHIGKYEVLGVAGRGAMGVVYVGRDPVIDRKVAIKVCTLPLDAEESAHMAHKLFLNEARLAGNLDHPNVLRIYDAGEENGDPYIIMEFVEGARTLQAHIKAETLLPAEQVLRYVQQCAEALNYAHAHGVVHRDIKPANLMLTGKDVVKIVDFGIAQHYHPDRTQLMGSFGSPRYMSPEQAAEVKVGPASDLYSLGATLFELLAGRPVFEGNSLVALLRRIIEEPPPRLRSLRPDLPESLERVIDRVLAKKAAERYPDGEALATDLGRVIEEMGRPEAQALPDEAEQLALLRDMRFLAGFPEANLHEILKAGTWEHHAPGTEIVMHGATDHAFYLLARGEVAVRRGNIVIETLRAGEVFGEMGFLARAERSASVIAAERVLVLKITADLPQWASLPCQTRFNKAFQRTLIERLARASERLARPVG